MKKFVVLLCLPFWAFSQNTIGLPDVFNYTKQAYLAGLQNWDIKQDKSGVLYFANNEGLLTFNGVNWNLFPLPNKTIVRSVEIGFDNRVYVGGQDELGYFSPAPNGQLQYHSLVNCVQAKDQSFGDVWDIVSYNKDIFFRSTNKIFKYTNETMAAFNAHSEWTFMTKAGDILYAHDYATGLKKFDNGVWVASFTQSGLPSNDPITAMIPQQDGTTMITTLKHGVYELNKTTIAPKSSFACNNLLQSERVYAATRINNDWIAFATSNQGVVIADAKGYIVQSFSKTEGLQNNNVLSIFLDNQSNLWLGLDNGIDMVAYNSAIKQINPILQNGSGYTAAIFNNKLYAGTSTGLYSVPLQTCKDLSFSKGNFDLVNNTKGQIWGLATINNQLLLADHDGASIIKENTAIPLATYPGFWNFLPLTNTFPASQMIAGNYKGLSFFDAKDEHFIPTKSLPDFTESSRFVAIDQWDNIWVSHPYHGVYKITSKKNEAYRINTYPGTKGLPSLLDNHVYKIKNEVVFATIRGVYQYLPQQDSFAPSPFYHQLLGNLSIRYLKEDMTGNIWFIHDKTVGVIDVTGKDPVIVYIPELTNKLLSGFEFIYPVDQNNIFLGGEKGFYHINYEKYKQTIPSLKTQVRSVKIVNKVDSLLFGGYFNEANDQQTQRKKDIPRVKSSWNTIRIEFSTPLYGYQSNVLYSYRLKGFEDNWCEWTKRTEKEYTNLPAGDYTFEVKTKNNLGTDETVATYSFKMLPPWYQTWWAYLLYFIMFLGANYLFFLWLKQKFRKQRARYEEEQKKLLYIHELERSKTDTELMRLNNEKLAAEINFKNSELASSAMHLLKKGDLLSKIKGDLTQVMKEIDNQHAIGELKRMIKSLNEDDHMDEEWEHFSNHFDNVHSDFLSELKELHPTVTPNELKLCAYLRMNLSTKEIAQLMNISVRGVEISRYRLRKKLAIQTETTLFDYLINIKKK